MANLFSFQRVTKAFHYSLQGLATGWRKDVAFRQEAMAAFVLIPFGLWLGDGAAEKALLAGSILLVMLIELLNSALERVVDRISLDRHELSKEAKDLGSAAVLVALILAASLWGVILVL